MNALKKFRKTPKGVSQTIFCSQNGASKRRGDNPPNYTLKEFRLWLFSQPNFEALYNNWVKSGYDKWEKPSVDRLDDYKGYSFDNIRLVTWKENHSKYHSDAKNGINKKTSKPIVQISLDGSVVEEHHSIRDAERKSNIHASNIRVVLNGNGNTAGGYKWKYA